VKTKLEQISAAAMPRVTRMQIVCGDCGGDGLLPRRTFLTSSGDCDRCGGRSYELASKLCQKLAIQLTKRHEETLAARHGGDVVIVDQAHGLY
jgi:DnaJ-class molecular chaperone